MCIKFISPFYLFIGIILLTACTNRPKWISGKWQPAEGKEDTISPPVFSSNRVGYEIIGDTLFSYTSKDYVSDPVKLITRILENNPESDPFNLSFIKVAKAKFQIKSCNDTICQIELLTGKELKFGYKGWGLKSEVIPGTIITFKKIRSGLIYERNFTIDSTQAQSVLSQQGELYFMIGNTEGGTYKMKLVNRDFNIDKSIDLAK